jgi:hypothetical protein
MEHFRKEPGNCTMGTDIMSPELGNVSIERYVLLRLSGRRRRSIASDKTILPSVMRCAYEHLFGKQELRKT